MPRDRHQKGWVEEVGKQIAKWRGHYYVYEFAADGTEKRKHKAPTLGLKSELKKWEAEKKLQDLIAKATASKVKPSPEHTLRWFWEHRFLPMQRWKPSSTPKTTRFIENYLLSAMVDQDDLIPAEKRRCFGDLALGELERFQIQTYVNRLADQKFSKSVVTKVIVYFRAILNEAVEQEFIGKNPARKLKTPPTKKPSERVLSQDEIAELLASMSGRDRLIVRMMMVLGLRPGEQFALRRNDRIAPGQLRIDETVSEELRGDDKLVEPKTDDSTSYVWLPESIQKELDFWAEGMDDQRPQAFLFASKRGTPMSFNNFLSRNLKPAAVRAQKRLAEGGHDLPSGFLEGVNNQVLRRTCATHMQHDGTVKDIQAHLRHSTPAVTLANYMKQIPESVKVAVERLDQKLMSRTQMEKNDAIN